MSDTSKNTNLTVDLPWDKMADLTKQIDFVDKAAVFPEETYMFAANPDNHSFMVESALKSLQNTDPNTATQEKAEALAGMMHIFAKMMVKELEVARKQVK